MIHINFPEPTKDRIWREWRDECKKETLAFIAAIEAGRGDEYNVTDLYKKENIKKKYYFNDDFKGPFWRKCAYCEESIASQNGDVEHFRPKKRVSDDNYKPIADHQGYYWLAYNWENLLPVCLKCNQRRIWEKEKGVFSIGKQDRFPLEPDSIRIFRHDSDLNKEKPLLINPLIDDPEKHLDVQLKSGIMLYKSNRGEKCIEIFGLNIRDDLRDGRKGTIERVTTLLNQYFGYASNEDAKMAASTLNEILKFVYGQKRFSLSARCFLKKTIGDDYKGRLEERLEHFKSKR